MNKNYSYVIIVFLLLTILCLLTYKTSEKVVFNMNKEAIIHDFGILNKKNVSVFEYTFKYVNSKYDSLKIYGVKDACDCTESKVKKGFYLKNDIIYIKTKYNPNEYNDSGNVAKRIFLITNKNISKFDTVYPLTLRGIVK